MVVTIFNRLISLLIIFIIEMDRFLSMKEILKNLAMFSKRTLLGKFKLEILLESKMESLLNQ